MGSIFKYKRLSLKLINTLVIQCVYSYGGSFSLVLALSSVYCVIHKLFSCLVFIFSSPGFKSSIRERMLYSSSKETFIAAVEQEFNCTVDKKVG